MVGYWLSRANGLLWEGCGAGRSGLVSFYVYVLVLELGVGLVSSCIVGFGACWLGGIGLLGWREVVLARFLGGGWAVGGILAGWWASTWVFLVVSLYLFAMCYLYGFLLGFPLYG